MLICISFSPLATGDTAMKFANAAPVPWPIRVILSGSPPKAGRFSRSQCSPATRSISPKLPCALPLAPVFRNPATQQWERVINNMFTMTRVVGTNIKLHEARLLLLLLQAMYVFILPESQYSPLKRKNCNFRVKRMFNHCLLFISIYLFPAYLYLTRLKRLIIMETLPSMH